MEAVLEKSRHKEGAKKLDDLPKGLNEGRPNRTPVKEKKATEDISPFILWNVRGQSFNAQITRQKISLSSSK